MALDPFLRVPLPTTHPTAAAAISEIVKQGKNIKVFGFGYYDRLITYYKVPSIVPRLVEEIFPPLAQNHGVRILSLEWMSAEWNSAIQEYLSSSGRVVSDLLRKVPDGMGMALLEGALSLYQSGLLLRVEGTHVSKSEAFQLRMMGMTGMWLQLTVDAINRHTVDSARRALQEGVKIALFNGMAHTTPEYMGEEDGIRNPSYIPSLLSETAQAGLSSDEFVAIRLIAPETLGPTDRNWKHRIDDYGYRLRAPQTGVHLRQDDDQGFTLVFSEKTTARHGLDTG